MPICSSSTHRERQRVHQALRDGAHRTVRQQVAADGDERAAHPLERCCQTPASQVLRRALPQPLTPAQPAIARVSRGSSSSPLAAVHAAQSASEEEEEPSAACRAKLDMAEVLRTFGPEYRRHVGDRLTVQQDRVLRELLVCRTEVLGSHQWACERCGQQVELFNSCKNRHCPQCGAYERRLWAAQVQADLLPIEYHHVVVTLPRPLTWLAFDHPRLLYPLVLRIGAEAILRLVRTELEVELAVLILLHSWGQLMNQHVHGHCLVSGGGLWLHGERFIQLKSGEFLSLADLAREFRDLFLQRLDSLHRRGQLVLEGDWRQLDCGPAWQEFLQPLRTIDWVVFSRGVWDRREEVGRKGEVARAVEYLAHYANRVAMSNGRLLAIEGDDVWFRYKDHRDGGAWKTTSLPGVEFIERFLWHLLPPGLRRIRRFGVWGNRVRTEKLTLLRRLLGVQPPESVEAVDEAPPTQREEESAEPLDLELLRLEAEQGTPRKCRGCGGNMVETYQTPRPTVAELMRMPPNMELTVESGPVQLYLPLSAFL